MVSKEGKLIILEDVLVNRSYSKYKRISKSINKDSSKCGVSVNTDEEGIVDLDELSFINYSEKDQGNKEKDIKDMTKEEIAYGIINSIDNSFLNDRYIGLNKAIPSRFQKYWDGLDTLVIEKLRGIDKVTLLESENNKSLFKKLSDFISSNIRDLKYLISKKSRMSVVEAMIHMKESLEFLETDEKAIDKLNKFINIIKKLDNNPLSYKAAIKVAVLSNESRILKNGKFLKYLSEDQVVRFIRKSERGLSISYLKEYNRDIPKEAIDKFNEAEKTEAFDNYIILHYTDKKETNSSEKHKNADEKRDPIMFGLIKGSRKLYYICDWIDEYCDLTLESLIKEIGGSEYELTD